MKVCDCCGRENEDAAMSCRECGTQEFKKPRTQVPEEMKHNAAAEPQIQPIMAEPKPARWQFRTLTANEMKLDLVTLLTCRSIVEADVVVGQLESIGVSAFIPDEFVAQAMAWNINGLGYVRVQVSPEDYERAKDFLLELSEIAEPDTAPNGGPALPGGSPSEEDGPPSVS